MLRARALIPKDWNLRSLTRGQKSWITKLTQKGGGVTRSGKERKPGILRDLIAHPKEFSVIRSTTRKQQREAKAGGFPTLNQRSVIHTGKGGRARRRGGKLVITESTGRRLDVWFANHKDFTKAVDKATRRKLKPNQTWGFNIGNRVNNIQHREFSTLMRYLEEKDDWHTPDATEYISLVLITENRRTVVASMSEGSDDE